MNLRETQKLNMSLASQEVLDDNSSIWNPTPPIVTKKTALDNSISRIVQLALIGDADISGNSADKKLKKLLMADKAIEVAGPMVTYARDNGDEILENEINFSLSEIASAKDSVSAERALIVFNKASILGAALTAYGILPADLTNLNGKIADFGNAVSNPRTAIAARETAKSELKSEFKVLAKILKEMDDLLRPFKRTAPDFYGTYKNARKIVDTGGRRIVLIAEVKDSVTLEGLEGADVTATPVVGGAADAVTVKTGSTGKARFKQLPSGTYDVSVKLNGYSDVSVINIAVRDDGVAEVGFVMVRL